MISSAILQRIKTTFTQSSWKTNNKTI